MVSGLSQASCQSKVFNFIWSAVNHIKPYVVRICEWKNLRNLKFERGNCGNIVINGDVDFDAKCFFRVLIKTM